MLPAGQVVARLGGASRLVFRVPTEVRIPFTIEGLLDWSKLELMVSPIADLVASSTQNGITDIINGKFTGRNFSNIL